MVGGMVGNVLTVGAYVMKRLFGGPLDAAKRRFANGLQPEPEARDRDLIIGGDSVLGRLIPAPGPDEGICQGGCFHLRGAMALA